MNNIHYKTLPAIRNVFYANAVIFNVNLKFCRTKGEFVRIFHIHVRFRIARVKKSYNDIF